MNKKGFTLLELLVVIAIIGLLATVAVASLQSARAKARDAVRLADIAELQKGLELFYDKWGVYPCGTKTNNTFYQLDSSTSCPIDPTSDETGFMNGCDENLDGDCDDPGEATNCHDITLGGLFSEGFVGTNCPRDPVNSNAGTVIMKYMYATHQDGQSYRLGTYLETDDQAMIDDGGPCNDAYEITNVGAGQFSNMSFNDQPGNDIGPSDGPNDAPGNC